MFFKQIKYRGDNFSYIVADNVTKEAVVVDPSFNAEAIVRLLRDKNLNVKYIINTHDHIDHIADNEYIKSNFNAKIVAHKLSEVKKDISVADGDVVNVGSIRIKVIHTPGHTPDSICLLVNGKLLTGDTLFVGECGRTDLPSGSPEDMYHSLHKMIKLDDGIEVYPGHDYGASPHSTIGLEKRTNYTLENRTLDEFIEFMSQP
jgi:glyoxylase-like metal-dependent hydrolase (beta-lactamase superfamily II)